MGAISHSLKEKEIAFQPEKVPNCAPGYLGPYRSDPNFTCGKKMGTMAVKSIPQNSYADPIHESSIQNNQIVVARKKVTKRVDRSHGHEQKVKRKGRGLKPHPSRRTGGSVKGKLMRRPRENIDRECWH